MDQLEAAGIVGPRWLEYVIPPRPMLVGICNTGLISYEFANSNNTSEKHLEIRTN